MTREQTAKLLQSLIGAYPDTFIKDAKATLDIWCLNFAEDDADTIYKATRLYMRTGTRFPAPADILKLRERACIYDAQPAPEAPELPSGASGELVEYKDWNDGCEVCPYADLGCLKDRCIV